MSNSKQIAPPVQIDVVLLAAGLSQRMGATNKLLLKVDGTPLIRKSAELYCGVSDHVCVVVGHETDQIQAALSGLPVNITYHENYRQGQQSSVLFGLTHISSTCDAVIIALADQPSLTSLDIAQFVAAFAKGDRDRAMIPYYREERGNPVILPHAMVDEINRDPKINSCRKFIDDNPDLTLRYHAPNNHFTTDVDTPEDAARLKLDQLVSSEPSFKDTKSA